MRWFAATLVVSACSAVPPVAVPAAPASSHWIVGVGPATSTLRLTVLDPRGRVVSGWASETAEHDRFHRIGGRKWFHRPGRYRLVVAASIHDQGSFRVEVPVQLRGDERLVWVEVGGYRDHRVQVRLLVPSDDVRLRADHTDIAMASALQIANEGDVTIEGVGNPPGWFQALWVRRDHDTVFAMPPPRAYCGTGLMPQPALPPGRSAPAGDSPWAMSGLPREDPSHAFVPFVPSGWSPNTSSGSHDGVEWSVVRLPAAELNLGDVGSAGAATAGEASGQGHT